MLREVGLIIAARGSILLIAPMSGWLFYYGFPLFAVSSLPLYFALPLIVLAFSLYNIKRLSDNNEKNMRYFAFFLVLAFVLSFILLFVILPYFRPNFIL